MIQKKDIKVSVIVPVYNGEKWLNRCLRSLVNQTLKEIQIICVNDCSTDNSLAILQQYVKKDKRIMIKNLKKNGGESIARNNGLKIAKGKYIAFIDQDDYVDLDFYEKLHECTKNCSVDVVKGNVKQKNNGVETISALNSNIKKNRFHFVFHWWSAIYKASFLRHNNIQLQENTILGADLIFLIKAVVNANKIITVDDVFYHYIRRVNSGDSKILNYKKINSLFKVFSYIFDYLSKKKISKKNYIMIYNRYFLIFLNFFYYRTKGKKNKESVCEKAIEMYKKCKYKLAFAKKYAQEFLDYLNTENKAKLFTLLQENFAFIFYPKITINNQKKYIYVWGKGEDSKIVIRQCEYNNWNITEFLDSNKKDGAISPQEILKKRDKNYFIIISSRKYSSEIAKTCKQAGLKEKHDFWRPH